MAAIAEAAAAPDGELLTAEQCSEIYQVSTQTIRAWTKKGKLQPVRMSRRCVRFRRADLPGVDQPEPRQ